MLTRLYWLQVSTPVAEIFGRPSIIPHRLPGVRISEESAQQPASPAHSTTVEPPTARSLQPGTNSFAFLDPEIQPAAQLTPRANTVRLVLCLLLILFSQAHMSAYCQSLQTGKSIYSACLAQMQQAVPSLLMPALSSEAALLTSKPHQACLRFSKRLLCR